MRNNFDYFYRRLSGNSLHFSLSNQAGEIVLLYINVYVKVAFGSLKSLLAYAGLAFHSRTAHQGIIDGLTGDPTRAS
jgi:hypothetical protein